MNPLLPFTRQPTAHDMTQTDKSGADRPTPSEEVGHQKTRDTPFIPADNPKKKSMDGDASAATSSTMIPSQSWIAQKFDHIRSNQSGPLCLSIKGFSTFVVWLPSIRLRGSVVLSYWIELAKLTTKKKAEETSDFLSATHRKAKSFRSPSSVLFFFFEPVLYFCWAHLYLTLPLLQGGRQQVKKIQSRIY